MGRSSSTPRRRLSPPKKIARVLESEARLGEFRQHIRLVAAMKSALWPFLPPSLRSRCELANFRDSALLFVADSPLWAARLRHASPQILHAARHRCKIPANKLRVRVVPKAGTTAPARDPRRISQAARDHLRRAAETMADEDLARQLKDLAERD